MRPGVLQDPAPQGRVGQHSGIGCELVLARCPCAADGGTAGGRFCAGFPRGDGGERPGGGVLRADEGSRSAEASAPPEGSREEEEEEVAKASQGSVSSCSRGSHSEIWTSFLWFFRVFGVWVLPDESWIIGLLGDDFIDVSVVYAQLGPILDTRTCVSLRVIWDGPLYLEVACSTLSVPEEYSFVVFLGDDFRIRHIQRFLV